MELKLRKRINNRLPKFAGGDEDRTNPGLDTEDTREETKTPSATGIGPWFALGEWAGGGIAAGLNSLLRSDAILQNAGTSEGSVNGISYQRTNDINRGQLMKDYDREMGMSFLTNPFKGLTMLFGRRKQRKSIAAALRQQAAMNTANRASAASQYLQQEYAKEYGDNNDQLLYAKNGKDAVHTSDGDKNIYPNAMIEDGEIVYNKYNSTAHVVPGNEKGDNNYAAILPSDAIISNKYGLSDRARFAAQALESINKKKKNRGTLGSKTDEFVKEQATRVLDQVEAELRLLREAGMLPDPGSNKYRKGKQDGEFVPDSLNDLEKKKKRKILSNWLIDGLGALTATGNLISDSLQRVRRSNTYASNPYASNALNDLAAIRINPYPINRELIDLNRRNIYGVDKMGGLSGAQKAYMNVANNLSMLSSMAKLNADIQKQNNAYRSAYATAAINAGQTDRAARMQANQLDLDYYSKAHAAKQQMTQMDMYNMLQALQQGYANSYKKYMFDNTIGMYLQEPDNTKNGTYVKDLKGLSFPDAKKMPAIKVIPGLNILK